MNGFRRGEMVEFAAIEPGRGRVVRLLSPTHAEVEIAGLRVVAECKVVAVAVSPVTWAKDCDHADAVAAFRKARRENEI